MSELCAATLTWLFTVFLDPINWDNAAWGLSGAIGDRQHVGGFTGLNGILVAEAVRRSVIERRPGTALLGPTIGAALATAIDPFVRGLSGHRGATDAFLHGLSIDPETPPTSLAPEATARLVAALRGRLEGSGVLPEFVAVLDQERWFLPSHGMDAEELSNLQSATGRAGIPGVGVAMALGDAMAFDRARTAETAWREGILRGLLRIEEKGVHSKTGLCWFESPETSLAGDAGRHGHELPPSSRAARPRLLRRREGADQGQRPRNPPPRRPGPRPRDRAPHRGERGRWGGGGHRVASGATIPPGTRDQFLEVADRAIAEQLQIEAAR